MCSLRPSSRHARSRTGALHDARLSVLGVCGLLETSRSVKVPKPETWRNPDYVRWVGSLPCVACRSVSQVQTTPTQAAHMRTKRNHGDKTCLPLCVTHHAQQHGIGIQSFLRMYKLRLSLLCPEYKALYDLQKAGVPNWEAMLP